MKILVERTGWIAKYKPQETYMNEILQCSGPELVTEKCELKRPYSDRGINILKKLSQYNALYMQPIQDALISSPAIMQFVAGIEKGQKLVLDISKESMQKIQSGEWKLMKYKTGKLKATLVGANGKVVKGIDLKYEDFCNVPDVSSLTTLAQMENMRQQLQEVIDNLEMIGYAVQNVIAGQHNDRIALYKSGEQIYLESKVIKDSFFQKQLLASSVKSLEDARMQMIENMKTDIADIVAYDNKGRKMKSEAIDAKIQIINSAFDVINKSSFLKAGIYYENGEIEAMMVSLKQYSGFLSDVINKNADLLYQYDKTDRLLDGEWHKRTTELPTMIVSLIDKYNADEQQLAVDYTELLGMGVIENE